MNMEIVSIEKKTFEMMVAAFGALSEKVAALEAQKRHGAHGKMAHGRGGLRAVENKPAHVADAARQAAYRLLADKPQVLLQAGGGEAADTACRHALSAWQMI